MLRGILIRGRFILLCTLILLVTSGVLLAQATDSKDVSLGNVLSLQDRLNKNLNEEALIRARMSAAFSAAARPHSAYLLHQKSLNLQTNRDHLQVLRLERSELIRAIEALADKGLVSQALLQGVRESSLMKNARKYSGSPMLSFQQAQLVYVANTSTENVGAVVFYRLLMAGFLLMAFSLPFIAIFRRGEAVPIQKRLVRVFPMFTINEAHGRRALLTIQLGPQGKFHSHLHMSSS